MHTNPKEKKAYRWLMNVLGCGMFAISVVSIQPNLISASFAQNFDLLETYWSPGQPPQAKAKDGNVKRPVFVEPGSVMTKDAECYATSENTIRCDVAPGAVPTAPLHAPFSFDTPHAPPGQWNVPVGPSGLRTVSLISARS